MKRVPQIFLAAFLADGLLSLAAIAIPSLSSAQKFVALIVLATAIVLHLIMALSMRLPKRLLLPATIFALLSFPIGLILGDQAAPFLAIGQILIGAGLLFLLHRPLLKPHPSPSSFSWPNFFTVSGLNVFLVCSFLILLILSGFSFVERKTNGYVRIRPDGISLEERWFQRSDGKNVRLIGMVHVAKDQFYEDLRTTLPEKELAIVLLEGVTDRGSLLQQKLNYANLAETFGLESQGDSDFMKHAAEKSFDPKDIAGKKRAGGDTKIQYWRADVDTSDFQESTLDCLEAVANLFSSKDLGEIVQNLTDPTSPLNQESDSRAFLYDVIDMRNEHLIGQMKDALKLSNTVVVPWGAVHMPVFEQKLKDWGFTETHRVRHLAFSFEKKSLPSLPAKP